MLGSSPNVQNYYTLSVGHDSCIACVVILVLWGTSPSFKFRYLTGWNQGSSCVTAIAIWWCATSPQLKHSEGGIGNLLPNNQHQRRTCNALCHILYSVGRSFEHCSDGFELHLLPQTLIFRAALKRRVDFIWKAFNLKLSGHEVYYVAWSLLVIQKDLVVDLIARFFLAESFYT